MNQAVVFHAATKEILHKAVEAVDVGALTPHQFAWLDLDEIDTSQIQAFCIAAGIPEREVADLLSPETEDWAQPHQEYVLSKVPVCHLEGDRVVLVPLVIVMTPAVIITARGGPVAAFDKVYNAYRESFETVGRSPAFIYFLVWDALVDEFLPKIAFVDNRLEDIEEDYMAGHAGAEILDRIAECRHMVRSLKKSLAPMQRVMRHLGGSKLELVSDEARAYLRQLFDHMDRLSQNLDSLQDRAHSTLAGYNSVLAQQQNNVLKVLTIIATIMMPLSLIAGIYGMNFVRIPGLDSQHGFLVVVGVMAALGVTMLAVFRLRKWL